MPETTQLRILHVLLSRGFAGSERSTAESCNQQSLDHNVSLIIRKDHRKAGVSIVDHLSSGVKVIEVNPRLFTGFHIAQKIKLLRPQVIHCHLRRSTRLIAKLNTDAATVSTLHIDANGPHFMRMDGLICNAKWQVENLPKSYTGNVHKAHNSLIPHRRLDKIEIEALRTDLAITKNDFLIGAVGRYHASKGWDTLITAFKQLHIPTAKLLFFGSGGDEQKLRALAEGDDRIQFIGYRKDVKDLYQCFDLMVCPSRFEPLPRVMLEGYDAGVPMIASDAGGCKELIEEYGGDLFKVDDIATLAKLLQTAVEKRPQQQYVDLSAHHLENANAAIVRFYQTIIAAKSN